jgi:hypothetical protein
VKTLPDNPLALDEPSEFHERGVRHVLSRLPSRAGYERVLAAIDQ